MKTVLIVLVAVVFISCNTSKNKDYVTANAIKVSTSQEHPGKALMKTNCYVCHSPSARHDKRIAPPMIAIKKHYINHNTTKEEFIKAIQDWIKNPTKENAKMHGAVRRFGVMPKTPFPDKTITLIADYMFDHTIEQPAWFANHIKNRKK